MGSERVGVLRRNKPTIEIMADVYDATLKYLEIEFLLTTELFGDDRAQFARIIADATTQVRSSLISHAQFMDLWEDALASVRELLTRPITEASDITEYLTELCATVNSAAIFIAFIADDEPRYQLLLRVGLRRRLHRRTRHLRPASAAGRAACRRCRRAAGS